MQRVPHPDERRKPLAAAAAAIAIVFAIVAPASAAPRLEPVAGSGSETEKVITTLSRRGDLTLRDSTLEGALFTISELWGVNIVAADVKGAVNGVFKDAPLREILDSILLSNGYAYRPVGGSLVVSRMESLGQINPFFVSETLSVGVADPSEVVAAAKLLSTPQGQVRALPSAGAVLVVDFPDRVEKVRALIQQIDAATRSLGSPGSGIAPRRLEVAYFRTHFIAAPEAQGALGVVLSPDGRVSALEGEDRLLVVDHAANVEMVKAVLARLDRPRPQVNIKALIYDITLSDLEELGVNWNLLTSGQSDGDGNVTGGNGLLLDTITSQPFSPTNSGGTFTFFSLNTNFNIQAVILALQQAEDSRLLSDPNVTVADNEPAHIESVTEVPFQQLTQTAAGGQIGTTAFKEAGIKLDVTPKIARDGTIDMEVIPEFSRVSGFTPGDNQPIIETRQATTRVRVRNGQTMMIAGLRQRSDVGDFDGIPYLKDMRFIGHLFRARNTQISESELVVFLTPTIVGYSDPLSVRDQLTSDTVGCRLDRIPAAEGCPCGPCYDGCGPVGHPAERIVMPDDGPFPTPAPAEVVPAGDVTLGNLKGLRQPGSVADAPRRLPTTEAAGEAAPVPLTGDAPAPMRPDFDARFRATGGVYPSQQRAAEAAPAPEADGGDREAKRPWYSRVWRR